MRAAKVDATQAAIVQALRGMGAGAISTATLGKGAADLLVYYLRTYVWLEIKVPGEKLNAMQQEFHATWPGPIHVVTSPAEAMRVVAEAARPKEGA
jgi:hypothetical protein